MNTRLIYSDEQSTNHSNELTYTLTVWGVVYFGDMEVVFEKNNAQYDHMFFIA